MLEKTLRVKSHITPYSSVSDIETEFYRLHKILYKKGFYRMERVLGFEYFEVQKPLSITQLEFRNSKSEKWHSLMLDDPLHWLGMKELASKCNGNVLVGGLGMGLILHHLLDNRAVQSITVIEIDPDLISFIQPYLPKNNKIRLVHANYFSHIIESSERYDSAIIDLWVLSEKSSDRQAVAQSMGVARALTSNIAKKVFIWGVREK